MLVVNTLAFTSKHELTTTVDKTRGNEGKHIMSSPFLDRVHFLFRSGRTLFLGRLFFSSKIALRLVPFYKDYLVVIISLCFVHSQEKWFDDVCIYLFIVSPT